MIELRNPQKRYLRGLGNGLKPTIHIGKSGLTESLLKAIQEALDDHELIKIRFLEYEREIFQSERYLCLLENRSKVI